MQKLPTLTAAANISILSKKYDDLRAPKEVRGNYKHVPRVREENEALPRIVQVMNQPTYRAGMGDTFHQPQRPGSNHSHLKSHGDRT